MKLDPKAKKSYGQHFLIQQKIVDRIVDLILDQKSANILEVGPGKGALTEKLFNSPNNFLAIDADPEMVEYLLVKFPNQKKKLILADFLRFNLNSLFNEESFLLCGNFPYNISSQIIFKALEYCNRIPIIIGMFQKEMAQRIISTPGSKDYGIISAISSLLYTGKIEFDIGSGNFFPPPKVNSSLLKLHRNNLQLSMDEYLTVKKFIKLSFQFRRKTLRNNLKGVISREFLEDKFFDQRPEDISSLEYLKLSKELILQ